MNQEAFRQLVSSSSAVAGPSQPSPSQRSFGKAHKRSTAHHPAATKPSDLKPRHLKQKGAEDTYLDRAAARRSGIPNTEFGDIEALHRDFEQRIAAAATEQERQILRDQISSVGGDAKHSVLVKGLDWVLLAQNKAKLERESNGASGEEEADLESAYQASRAEDPQHEEATGKKSREEVMDAIRRRREARTSEAAVGGKDAKERTASAFRPIGFKPIASADKPREDEEAEYKWVNGKRMRKKKKKSMNGLGEEANAQRGHLDTASIGAASQEVLPTEARSSNTEKKDESRPHAPKVTTTSAAHVATEAAEKPTSSQTYTEQTSAAEGPLQSVASSMLAVEVDANCAPAAAKEIPAAPTTNEQDRGEDEAEQDEDEDIFADVGGWHGIPDTKDDEDHESDDDPRQQPPASPLYNPITSPAATLAPGPGPGPAEVVHHSIPVQQETSSSQHCPNRDAVPHLDPAHAEIARPTATQSESVPQPKLAPSVPVDVHVQQDKPNHKKSKWDLLDNDRDAKKKKKRKKLP